jgi:hypothetical protein
MAIIPVMRLQHFYYRNCREDQYASILRNLAATTIITVINGAISNCHKKALVQKQLFRNKFEQWKKKSVMIYAQ